jgi:hypothetical protein
MSVVFRAEQYGPEVARVLALARGGTRLMPLLRSQCVSAEAREAVRQLQTSESVRSGLYLYFCCWEEAHSAADSVETPDGYFWHAIVHRQEPDAANAAYWFGKTGAHPVFPELAAEAAKCGYQTGPQWDPYAFIEFCGNREEEQLAMQVQLVEWQLLFDHCARERGKS